MRAAQPRVQSHPAPQASPTPTNASSSAPNRANLPGFKDPPPPGKRRVPSEPEPQQDRQPPAEPEQQRPEPEAPRVQPRTVSPEEAENDPLVKTVLDVFEGEVKRVHPKNN